VPDIDAQKQRAGVRAVDEIRDGMVVGLGTGSTTTFAIREVGRRVAQSGLKLTAAATSTATGALAVSLGIPLLAMGDLARLDLVIDGADELDPRLWAIKGGGGALFREKIVAAAADRVVIVVDSSKPVEKLGKFALPVEVHPFALGSVKARISALGGEVKLRSRPDGTPFLTDQQANIFDIAFGQIDDPQALAAELQGIPGVLVHGLFLGLIDMAIVGNDDGVSILHPTA
jgi:ribose 5-phosphate isomerase A